VTKRNGQLEDFNLDKIHKVIAWAIEGLEDVSLSDIEMNAKLNLFDGVSTREIHQIMVRSANDLISEATPDYQYVAARLANYALRKDVWGGSEPPRLCEHITACVNEGVYDPSILEAYTQSEIHKLNKFIKHDRDDKFTYAGIQQLIDKYLVKNRVTGQIYETPQFAYMLIAMTCFSKYDKSIRLDYVKKAYDYFSQFKISLPTPIIAGVRTKLKQFASCILLSSDDSLNSIYATSTAIGQYVARRAGIGVDVSAIRPINSPIRDGDVVHTGIIPFLKLFESSIKCCSQGGLRKGSACISVQWWHYEIEDIIVLKNNAGTDENRVRGLDYTVNFSRLFYERLIKDEDITLFSPHETKGLLDVFGLEGFDSLYEQYEKDDSLKFKKKIKARALAELYGRERLETGRIYAFNIDHANTHSSFIDRVLLSNLCLEVCFPVRPLESVDDEKGMVGTCMLGALNMLETKLEEIPAVADILVRLIEEIIDLQEYPIKAGENFTKQRRSIGVGITNLAAYLAKHKANYDSKEALALINQWAEHLQYYLLSSSAQIAKEKGPCEAFGLTKYSLGILPIDTYKKTVDELVGDKLELDWEALRASIKDGGLRHSTMTCVMPAESSSCIQNSTNGMEPPRALISHKKSKSGTLKQVVPNLKKWAKYYTLAFDVVSNETYTRVAAVLQKYFDMSLSTNHYYNYSHYPDGIIPLSVLTKDMLYAYKMGLKSLYYANTPDGEEQVNCAGGGCAL
jgi:ribonucleoside-diphosphate reductase alpha chain